MQETTREQDAFIDSLAWAFGAVGVEPVAEDGSVGVIVARPDVVTPLALRLHDDGEIIGGGAA